MKKRTFINLVTVVLASSVLALYALTQLVAGAVFGQGYPVYVDLPEAGGLTENKQVTYRGVGIGSIADADLHEDGVRLEDPLPLAAVCRCTPERVTGMLRAFPEDQRAEMVEEDGKIRVTCEYCSTTYEIAPESV